MATTDLGWCMARCVVTADNIELTVMEPASEDSPANSISLSTIEAIIALRDLIDEELENVEARALLTQDMSAGG